MIKAFTRNSESLILASLSTIEVYLLIEIVDRLARIKLVRGFARINFIKLIEFLENILAILSTISMSHMQDVILEKTRSGRYYCLFLPILYSCL